MRPHGCHTGLVNPIVVYADGADGPLSAPSIVAEAAQVSGSPEVLMCWTVAEPAWLQDAAVVGRTGMAGYGLANAVARGQIEPLSMRISAMPNLLRQTRPDVVVVTGVRRGNSLVYGQTVSWIPIATEAARRVVVEIDETGYDLGGPEITGNVVATLTRPSSEPLRAAARPADDVDFRIGELVASLVPDDATLQFGPGGIGEGIVRALDKPVSIFSGLVTDAMADLADRGLLNGVVTAAYAWGGDPIRRLAASGRLRWATVEVTNDITALSAIPRFIGCNTALQVGLDGSVNVERVGGRLITSIGGHADFCAGASRSLGGMSVIALRSTTLKGVSNIVHAAEVVSTPKCDVSVVVTEHGIADLRGVGDIERGRRLAAIAAPQHRTDLLS
jgi:acyl-CoA hydrolase